MLLLQFFMLLYLYCLLMLHFLRFNYLMLHFLILQSLMLLNWIMQYITEVIFYMHCLMLNIYPFTSFLSRYTWNSLGRGICRSEISISIYKIEPHTADTSWQKMLSYIVTLDTWLLCMCTLYLKYQKQINEKILICKSWTAWHIMYGLHCTEYQVFHKGFLQ